MLKLSQPVTCIIGPTASGKTALAQQLALKLNGEVVSADSMQIYTGMDIGTGKLLPQERKVKHHGFDLLSPGEPFSAALFQPFARNCFRDIDARNLRSVLCGGTGFYIRAAIDDYDFTGEDAQNSALRDHYNKIAQDEGADGLWSMLNERDPQSATLIPAGDIRRVIRAFELLEEGKTYAEQKSKLAKIKQYVPAIQIGLQVDPDVLRKRIDKRVDTMIEEGLLSEVESLLEQGFRDGLTAPQAIGYKELVEVFDGNATLDSAIASIKFATHRYAKRQRTWFRKDSRIIWIPANRFDLETLTEEALELVNKRSNAEHSMQSYLNESEL